MLMVSTPLTAVIIVCLRAQVWDIRRLERDVSFASRLTYAGQSGRITSVCAVLDGGSVASASSSGSLHVWRVEYTSKPGGWAPDKYRGMHAAPPVLAHTAHHCRVAQQAAHSVLVMAYCSWHSQGSPTRLLHHAADLMCCVHLAACVWLQASLLYGSCLRVRAPSCRFCPGPTTLHCCCTPANGAACTAVTCAVQGTPGMSRRHPAWAWCSSWWPTPQVSTGWLKAPAGAGSASGMYASCCASTAGSTLKGERAELQVSLTDVCLRSVRGLEQS